MYKFKVEKTKEEFDFTIDSIENLVKNPNLSPHDLITVYHFDVLHAIGEVEFWEKVAEGSVDDWSHFLVGAK